MIIYIKLFIGLVLFGTLVALTYFQVPHSERLLDLIYTALIGLGITHLAESSTTPPSDKQGGFAHPALLAGLGVASLMWIAGCSGPTTQTAAVRYTQACTGWSMGFAAALELRRADKLTPGQIEQITILDSQVTPLCTGPLPLDMETSTARITAAVASIAVLEAVR